MLLTKTVMMRWNSSCKEWYKSKGYIFTKYKDEFEVNVEDLSDGSNQYVEVKCDCEDCENPYLKPMTWQSYKKYVKYNGKYYCQKCAMKLYGVENTRKTKLKYGKSFEKWCIDNNRQDVLDRWDYELNKCKPSDICWGTGNKYYFKCPNSIHKSELKSIGSFTSGQEGSIYCNQCNSFEQWCLNNNRQNVLYRWDYELNKCKPSEVSWGSTKKYYFKCPRGMHESELKNIKNFVNGYEGSIYCNQCNSFKQWCIENNRQDVLDRWDYELNNCLPSEISYGTGKKYYFKCSKGLHKSELKSIGHFINGEEGSIKCKACNSFAQWGIDNISSDFLDKYWDWEKNKNIDPWKITYASSNDKVWIKCQEKEYHGSYDITCNDFVNKVRCPYCNPNSGNVHKLDSLGSLYPKVLQIWSEKNKKSPYEYAPKSQQKVYWKCPEGKHEDYLRNIQNSNKYNFRCPECQYSKGEERISKYLIKNSINYISQKIFDVLIGLGGGNLSYDFYLPQLNLLIEYQGEQHKKYMPGFHKSKKDFEKQQEHDRRKREYAKKYGIRLLEIWYWDFDNIEEILDKELNQLNNQKCVNQ
jgi:hypothetical protein